MRLNLIACSTFQPIDRRRCSNQERKQRRCHRPPPLAELLDDARASPFLVSGRSMSGRNSFTNTPKRMFKPIATPKLTAASPTPPATQLAAKIVTEYKIHLHIRGAETRRNTVARCLYVREYRSTEHIPFETRSLFCAREGTGCPHATCSRNRTRTVLRIAHALIMSAAPLAESLMLPAPYSLRMSRHWFVRLTASSFAYQTGLIHDSPKRERERVDKWVLTPPSRGYRYLDSRIHG